MKKKKYMLILLILLLGVGGTLAFFTSTSELENEFKSGRYKTVSTDNFTSPSDWKPGDTTPKTITTKNEGTMPVRVRVKLEESWESENGNDLPLFFDVSLGHNDYPIYDLVSIINYDNETDWIFYDDYFYYVGELAPGEETSSLIESITYNPNTPSDMNCTSNNGVYNCKSTGDGYDGGTYTLNVVVESVQSEAVLSAWNLSSDPAEEKYYYLGRILWVDHTVNVSNYDFETDFQSINRNVFLRYKAIGETIREGEVGFVLNNNVYYIKGGGSTYNQENNSYNGDSIFFEENKNTLFTAFGSENCVESIFNNYNQTTCSLGNITVNIFDYGGVRASSDTCECYISDSGRSSECLN